MYIPIGGNQRRCTDDSGLEIAFIGRHWKNDKSLLRYLVLCIKVDTVDGRM